MYLMKRFYWAIIILVAFSCKQKEKSFDRIYLVEYGYSLRWLKEGVEGIPPLYITSLLKIESSGSVVNGNRGGEGDTTFVFREQGLSSQIFDSLSLMTKIFDKDTTFGVNDLDNFPGTFDGALYAFIIERENEKYLIDFDSERHQITQDLRSLLRVLLDKAHTKKGREIEFNDLSKFQGDFRKILKQKSRRLPPPPIRITIKFLPPKVDSVSAKK